MSGRAGSRGVDPDGCAIDIGRARHALPGSPAAALAHASPSPRADSPRAPAARNPASMASPAPTLRLDGALAVPDLVAVDEQRSIGAEAGQNRACAHRP